MEKGSWSLTLDYLLVSNTYFGRFMKRNFGRKSMKKILIHGFIVCVWGDLKCTFSTTTVTHILWKEKSRENLVSIGIEVEARILDTEKLPVEVSCNFVVFNLFRSRGESLSDPRIFADAATFFNKVFSQNKPPVRVVLLLFFVQLLGC